MIKNKLLSRVNICIGAILAALGIGVSGCQHYEIVKYGVPYLDSVDTMVHPMYGVLSPQFEPFEFDKDSLSELNSNSGINND